MVKVPVVVAKAADRFPGHQVDVESNTDIRVGHCQNDGFHGPEDELVKAAVVETPLPWSGIDPEDYLRGQQIENVERAAARLPHLRLS